MIQWYSWLAMNIPPPRGMFPPPMPPPGPGGFVSVTAMYVVELLVASDPSATLHGLTWWL